jgi:hypothetical protein
VDDIEITKIIENLKWDIDLVKGTIKSELIHYEIIERAGYTDLKAVWISPDMPTVTTVINNIQRQAAEEYKKAKGSHNDKV